MKQRLIGAAVLVALAVIFLPMLLEEPAPEPGAESVQLDIPAPPARDFETRELPLEPLPADDPDRIVTVEAGDRAPVDARPEDQAGAAPEPAPAAAEPPAPVESGPAAAATTPEPPPPAPAAPAAAPAAAPGGGYVLNLGSYANIGNAEALQKRLRDAGLAVSADRISIDGKPALRLRAGPYASRAEAERAGISAGRVQPGLKSSVTALDAVEAPADARGNFAVQVGAFAREADAVALRDRLRGAGFAAFLDRVDTDDGPMVRVRAGPELDRARADRLKAQLAERLGLDGLVVTHP